MLAADDRRGHWNSKQGAKNVHWKQYIAFKLQNPHQMTHFLQQETYPHSGTNWGLNIQTTDPMGDILIKPPSLHISNPMRAWCKP